MAKNIFLLTDEGRYAYGFIKEPDTKAPAGATWKPDGKYKASIVFADAAADQIIAKVREAAQAVGYNPDDELFKLPYSDAGTEKRPEDAGKLLVEAKSQFQPRIHDGSGQWIKGLIPKGGDTVRAKFELVPFEKDDEVKERVNGKLVTTKVKMRGISLRLWGIQITGRDDAGGFGAVEGGFVAGQQDTGPQSGGSVSPDGDGGDF